MSVKEREYQDRMIAYYEALAKAARRFTPEQEAKFQQWQDQYPSARNSDWPGWIQLIGARPVRERFEVIELNARAV